MVLWVYLRLQPWLSAVAAPSSVTFDKLFLKGIWTMLAPSVGRHLQQRCGDS